MEQPAIVTSVSRRRFLKRTAYGLGAATLAAPAVGRALGANERVHFAVIGCGGEHCGRGTDHLQNLVKRSRKDDKGATGDNVDVIGICDIYERHKQQAKAIAPSAEVYHDFRKLLERKDLDAVVIATPDHWHAPMAIAAMESGKHLYLEKPMTLTIEEAKEVYRTSKRTNRVVEVGPQATSKGKYWAAAEAIKKGVIGKVVLSQSCYCRNSPEGEWNYPIHPDASPQNLDWKAWLGSAPQREFSPERFFRWRKYWDYSGGVATDLFYHRLAPLLIAIGQEFPSRVTASGGIFVQHDGREVPDTYSTTIDYPSGHTIIIAGSMANDTRIPEVIRGTKATIHLGDDNEDEAENRDAFILAQDAYAADFKKASGGMEKIKLDPIQRDDMITDLVMCIRDRSRTPNCDALLGYKVMVAIKLGVDAYRNSCTMRFDPEKEAVVKV
jgi:predicted dehydrogenase